MLLLGGLIQSSLLISFTLFWMLETQGLKEAIRDSIDEYLEGGKKKKKDFICYKTLQDMVSHGRGRQWEPLVRLTHQFLVLIYFVMPTQWCLSHPWRCPRPDRAWVAWAGGGQSAHSRGLELYGL